MAAFLRFLETAGVPRKMHLPFAFLGGVVLYLPYEAARYKETGATLPGLYWRRYLK